jgi:hypothetical protein
MMWHVCQGCPCCVGHSRQQGGGSVEHPMAVPYSSTLWLLIDAHGNKAR